MVVTHVFLRVLWYTTILINTRGRSSAGRAPALQVDKPKRCAFMRLRRWRMSAEARIIRSSARAQNRLREPEGETLPVQPTPDVQQALHLSDTRNSVDVTPDGTRIVTESC